MKKSQRSRVTVVPLADQLRSYDRGWLRGDLIAGVTVAALIVPKNLGYAGIAGIPLQNGLYAAAAGAIVYGTLGSCRQISMGPSSGLAAVAASAVLAAGITSEQDAASFVAGSPLPRGSCSCCSGHCCPSSAWAESCSAFWSGRRVASRSAPSWP